MNFFTQRVRRLGSLSSLDPERDWIILLIVATIVLIIVVVWNAYVFDTVATGGVIGSPTTTAAPVFSQSSLDAIHTVFENRAAEETKYTSDVYHYADPSQ